MQYLQTVVFLLFSISCLAQVDAKVFDSSDSTSYFISYADQLNLKVFGILKSNQIGHYDNFTEEYVYYRPNENFNLGIGVSHYWLGLDIAINFPFINNDNDIFGDTRRFDIQASAYIKRLAIDFNYQKYQGYYGSNAASYIPGFNINQPEYPIRPDIRSFNLGANALWIFSPHRFSYRAAFVYNERQIRSGGSWLLTSGLSIFEMDADSTIIPIQLRDRFNTDADFRDTRYVNLGLGGGYGHTFVIGKKWFFSLTLAVGLGPTFKNDKKVSETDIRMAVRATVRAAIGFNGPKYFYGISSVSAQSSEVDILLPHLERNINHTKIFFGRRFGAPAFTGKLMRKKE